VPVGSFVIDVAGSISCKYTTNTNASVCLIDLPFMFKYLKQSCLLYRYLLLGVQRRAYTSLSIPKHSDVVISVGLFLWGAKHSVPFYTPVEEAMF
jgi:hypothetical protein